MVDALYKRYAKEVQWPQVAPDSVKINWVHVMAQALAPLHFTDREETQPAIGGGSHAALQACHGSGHTATPRSLSGSGGNPPAKCTISNSDTECLQVQLAAQIKGMQDEIIALKCQVELLQAHLRDATGCVAVPVHPQLEASPKHFQRAGHEHTSEAPRCIAQVIRDAQRAAVVRSRSNSVASHASDNIGDMIQAAQWAAERGAGD